MDLNRKTKYRRRDPWGASRLTAASRSRLADRFSASTRRPLRTASAMPAASFDATSLGAPVTLVTAPAQALVTASRPASAQRACYLLAATLSADTVEAGDPSPTSASITSVRGLEALARLATSPLRRRCSISSFSSSASHVARLRCASLSRIHGWRDCGHA